MTDIDASVDIGRREGALVAWIDPILAARGTTLDHAQVAGAGLALAWHLYKTYVYAGGARASRPSAARSSGRVSVSFRVPGHPVALDLADCQE